MNSLTVISYFIVIVSVYSRRLNIFDENIAIIPDQNSDDKTKIVFNAENKRSNGLPSKLPANIQKQVSIDMRSPLTDKDFRRAKLLTVENFMPMENVSTFLNDPQYFEGDINEKVTDRNAIRNPRVKWSYGRVPYVISDQYNEQSRAVIARAFQEYHEKTCVKFIPRTTNDQNYIYIYPSSGCYSQVGMAGGMQAVSIGQGCAYVGIVEHELMHALGFWHEQSRTDRDLFVRINWQNIQSGMAYNFEKYTQKDIQYLGESYDYKSVMHYGSYAFAKGSQPTIVPLKPGAEIGQRYSLSKTDIIKINKLYECVDHLKSMKTAKN